MYNTMTDEMIDIATKLHALAAKYRDLYNQVNNRDPVIWITHNDTGESIIIADSFNTEIIKQRICST
jgi:hypothetical protein